MPINFQSSCDMLEWILINDNLYFLYYVPALFLYLKSHLIPCVFCLKTFIIYVVWSKKLFHTPVFVYQKKTIAYYETFKTTLTKILSNSRIQDLHTFLNPINSPKMASKTFNHNSTFAKHLLTLQ